MTTLELRPPQFSEDLAWLPCWLQHNQTTPSSEQGIDSRYESAIKEFVNNLGDANHSPKDGECNSYNLFLSGQDSSLESITPSSNNALHFHLHLSSYGGSECTPPQDLDGSHSLEYNKVQSIGLVEASLNPRENISSKEGNDDVDIDFSPQSSNKDIVDNVVCQSLTNSKDHDNQWGEKSNVSCLKSAEADNAVELSVVASEALVIHDFLKTEIDTEALSAEAVLEVSIQVKRARIELLESSIESLNEEMDWSDSLSDLDDLTMRDAFDDVGLPCGNLSSDQRAKISFEVQDTYADENQSTHGSQCNSIDMRSPQDELGNGFSLKQLEENLGVTRSESFPLAHASCNIQNQLLDDVVLASTSQNYCKYEESMVPHSGQNESDEFVVKQKIVPSIVNTSLCMIQTKGNSSLHDCTTVSANNEEWVAFFAKDRFKSRWLGGWTCQEEDVSEQSRPNGDGGKTIPSMFANETSFLSESADIAPDANSCVQRSESKFQVASQSSVPFGHSNEKGDEGLPATEDVVKCSLSLVDPLCSFVPCSISFDTDCAEQNLNEGKDFTKERVGASEDIGSPRSVRRQSTSLKTYSTILPSHVDLERKKLDNNYSHQLQNITILPWKRNFVETLPSMTASKSRNMDILENCEMNASHNLNVKITEQKSKGDEVAGDGSEFLVQSVNKLITPDILNQSLEVSKTIMKKPSIKKDNLQSLGTETMCDRPNVANIMKMPSESKVSLEPCMLVQKRVHFSEANDQPQENQDLQKVQPSHKNYSDIETGKRRKFSNQCSVSRHRDGSDYLKSRHCKSRKLLIFQGIQFLVTGFSSRKVKDIEGLVWNNGGMVLPDIPCPSSKGKNMSKSNCKGPPVILSSKKLQTTKFLYGCAVNAPIVKVSWVTDSIAAGSMLPPWRYMIISNQADCTQMGRSIRHSSRRYIFENVGIMLHGKQGFCTKLTKAPPVPSFLRCLPVPGLGTAVLSGHLFIQQPCSSTHGGGQVFKTLQWLVKSLNKEKLSIGVIVVDDEFKASRHLKQCALEQGIPLMSTKWAIKSLHLGELLPLTDNQTANKANVAAFREASLEL